MRRVVITGVGPITSIGVGKEEFWAAIKEQRSGIGPVSRFDASVFKATSSAEVLDWKPDEYFFLEVYGSAVVEHLEEAQHEPVESPVEPFPIVAEVQVESNSASMEILAA